MADCILFKGPSHPLSNLFTVQGGLPAWGRHFCSLEQAYQFEKARIAEDRSQMLAILSTNDPWEILAIGKKTKQVPCWLAQREAVMRQLLRIKAQHCPQFRQFLINSGNRPLFENTRHPFWAQGMCGEGKNWLGLLLQEIRAGINYGLFPAQF